MTNQTYNGWADYTTWNCALWINNEPTIYNLASECVDYNEYRKILVIAEDDGNVRPKRIDELFDDVRKIHFLSYLRYLYFNIGRMAYLQANVLSAYVFLAPAIVAGVVTLGVMQQIIRAFGRVEGSMQYLLKAWPTIIELASVYKRLREFEANLPREKNDAQRVH